MDLSLQNFEIYTEITEKRVVKHFRLKEGR